MLSRTTSKTHLALLRGVNVGGNNMLPMKALAQMFVDSGCSDVRTYIHSGNVVFSAPARIATKIPHVVSSKISDQFGFRVPVVMRSADEMAATIGNNPFMPAVLPAVLPAVVNAVVPAVVNDVLPGVADPKTLHVMFLADLPAASAVASLDPGRSSPDAFRVAGRDIYLHLPNGAARSKLTNAYFDSKLATISTSRNWATVLKLAEWMAAG